MSTQVNLYVMQHLGSFIFPVLWFLWKGHHLSKCKNKCKLYVTKVSEFMRDICWCILYRTIKCSSFLSLSDSLYTHSLCALRTSQNVVLRNLARWVRCVLLLTRQCWIKYVGGMDSTSPKQGLWMTLGKCYCYTAFSTSITVESFVQPFRFRAVL